MSRWGKAGFVGTGMSGWDPDQAERDAGDNQMFAHMLQPPPELMGRGAAGQGEQQVPGQQMPMGDGGINGQPQAPIGAGASPFGATKDPRQVMKTLHEVPERMDADDPTRWREVPNGTSHRGSGHYTREIYRRAEGKKVWKLTGPNEEHLGDFKSRGEAEASLKDSTWDEGKHPRDADGKFV
jgi:hypothetical protein